MTAEQARALTREAKRRRASGPSDAFEYARESARAHPVRPLSTTMAAPVQTRGRSVLQMRLGLLADPE